MARKVFVTSDMSVDERMIEVAERDSQAALLWPWILTAFDDWGRSNADSKRLKASIFPAITAVTPESIDAALRLYAEVGLIILYEYDGKQFMAIPADKWFKYQTHIRSQKRVKDDSRYPAPPGGDDRDSAQMRASARECAQISAVDADWQPSPSPSPSPSLSPTAAASVPGVVSTTEVGSGEPDRDELAAAEVDRKTSRSSSGRQPAEPSGHGQVLSHIAKRLHMLPTQIGGRDLADLQDDCARHGPDVVMRAIDLACEAQLRKGKHKRGDPALGPDIRSYQFCREFLNDAKGLVDEEEAIQRDREIGARRRAETRALIDELLAAGGG